LHTGTLDMIALDDKADDEKYQKCKHYRFDNFPYHV
jgi:hypothetical protein